ncbi:MAG: site-specific recombinase XerD [Clostridium sp.]|jgi:site-specific recombinase XerD
MFSEFNVTNIRNIIEVDAFQSKSDWYVIINYFECFLKEKYKRKYTIDAYLKDVKQYIDWYYSNNLNKYAILNNENLSRYELYLQSVKKYKQNTITYKKVALRKIDKFLIEFNQQNSNEESSNYPKTNRSQYNYLTESYIRL